MSSAGSAPALVGTLGTAVPRGTRAVVSGLALLSLAIVALTLPAPSTPVTDGREVSDYGKLPLSFVPNRGQADSQVRYLAQTGGASFQFTQDRIAISLSKGDKGHALHLRFLGANPNPTMTAGERQRGKVNYIAASERQTNIPTFAALTYRELWPGIDMAIRGRGGALKYEFHLAAGADPSNIRLAYAGASGLALTEGGALNIATPLGALADKPPRSFQGKSGVDSRYALHGERTYGFALGAYDRSRPLVIDPGLAYSTFLGGGESDGALDVAIGGDGSAYVVGSLGYNGAVDYPTTPGAFRTTMGRGQSSFVTKVEPDGSGLVYSTYLHETTIGDGIAVGVDGSAYVTGIVQGAADFPTTPNAFDRTLGGFNDRFVLKLNPSGSALDYSTLLGGSADEQGGYYASHLIAIDEQGHAYVTTHTQSSDFPTTPGAFDSTYNGNGDAIVAKLSPDGSSLVYSTFVGGTGSETYPVVTVDRHGRAYVAGETTSRDFPVTPGSFDTAYGGGLEDAFLLRLSADGSASSYAGYVGGSVREFGNGVAVDPQGSAYVTGITQSPNFPTTPGAHDRQLGGSSGDAYVMKVQPDGLALSYSTFVGGAGEDQAEGIAVNARGEAHITGLTFSNDFPTTQDALDPSLAQLGNAFDAFFTKLDTSGSSLVYSTYIGDAQHERGFGVAAVGSSAYLAGETTSSGFPTTSGAFDRGYNGHLDAYLMRFGPGPPATLGLTPTTATNPLGSEHCVTATSIDASGEPTPDITIHFSVTGSVETSGSQTTDANGQASFCYQGPQSPGADQIVAYADTNDNEATDPGEPVGGATKTWVAPQSTPDCSTSDRGQITTQSGSRAFFRGRSQTSLSGQPSGSQTYNDRTARIDMRSISIDALVCSGDDATIYGRARVNGDEQGFRIDLHDGGNHRRDSYRIVLSSGYDSGTRTLRGGNVRVR